MMRMLNRLAHRHKQLQPLLRSQPVRVAKLRNRLTFDHLHHEVRCTRLGDATIKDPGDVGMIHQG